MSYYNIIYNINLFKPPLIEANKQRIKEFRILNMIYKNISIQG